jgi:hypothetical protein
MLPSDEEIESPYCPVCGACGIDECCPPQMCKRKRGCLYPDYDNSIWIKIKRPFYFPWIKIKNKIWKWTGVIL